MIPGPHAGVPNPLVDREPEPVPVAKGVPSAVVAGKLATDPEPM